MSTEEDIIQQDGPICSPDAVKQGNSKKFHLGRASKVWEDRFLGNPPFNHFLRNRTASQVIGKRHSFAGHNIGPMHTSFESVSNNPMKFGSQIGSSRNSIKEHLLTMIALDDSKLCLKFFGTKRAVHLEQKRLFNQQVWIIHPYCRFK